MPKGDRNKRIKLLAGCWPHDERLRSDAVAIVGRWNADLAADEVPQFSPTIGAAVHARRSWLRVLCPGCRQVYELDLRRVVRSADFPVSGLMLTCESGCLGQGPKPKLLALVEAPIPGAVGSRHGSDDEDQCRGAVRRHGRGVYRGVETALVLTDHRSAPAPIGDMPGSANKRH
jgi:hypothetical protein